MARRIVAEIDIAASAATVWSILLDFAAYPDWNPFVVAAAGDPVVGGQLDITVQPPGGQARRFRPRVLVSSAPRELCWRGRFILPGLFDGEHSFRIEPAATGIRFAQAETFSGLLVALMPPAMFEQIARGFDAMNRALKTRAEAAG